MSEQRSSWRNEPLHLWLPSVVLKFLVFAVYAGVICVATVWLGNRDLGAGWMWVIIAGMAGLLLLLSADRLIGFRVTASGVEATLAEAKVRALDQVNDLEDREAAEAARTEILQAQNREQIEAARAVAVELNVNRIIDTVKQAIAEQRKIYVRYRSDPEAQIETYLAIPLDIKPGKTPATKANDYLWVYSDKHDHVISLRLGRVLGVELSDETFEPAEVMADWKTEKPEWNVPREW